MKKDTFYFSHDYNTRSDPKIGKLLRIHGMAGYGIWWSILEILYQNANAMPTDYDSIAYDLHTDCETVKSIINDFDLFVVENEFFYSESVNSRLGDRLVKSEKARESAYKRWDKSERNANAMRTQCAPNAIKGKEIKVKESKVKGEEHPAEFQSIIYSIEEIEERLTAETFIDNFASAMKTDPRPAREFITDWIAKKKLSGDYCYPIARLRSFLIADFEKSTKTNGFYGNSKKSARAERFLGDQDIEGFKGF